MKIYIITIEDEQKNSRNNNKLEKKIIINGS